MSEPDTLPTDVHPEAALLPWFVNNTLGERERQVVVHHLETCNACRSELTELTQIRAQLTALYAAEPRPSSVTGQSILQRIRKEVSAQGKRTISQDNWLDRLDHLIRSALAARMVPSLTAVVLLTLSGLLIWATVVSTQPEQVTSRSMSSPSVRFSVIFQRQATDEQIRSLLNTIRGRVVDGPTPKGAYVIEVLAADQETGLKKLETLRSEPNVTQSAELEQP